MSTDIIARGMAAGVVSQVSADRQAVSEDRAAVETAKTEVLNVAESIPEDYSTLSTDVSELKEDLDDLSEEFGIEYLKKIGTYCDENMAWGSDGSYSANNSVISTHKLELLGNVVHCSSKILLYALFDETGAFIERVPVIPTSNDITIENADAFYISLMFNKVNYPYDTVKESGISGVLLRSLKGYKEIVSTVDELVPTVIEVGTGKTYTRFIDALNAVKNTDKKVTIKVYTGEYDVYEEIGGDDFVASISSSATWKDGYQPILHGNVEIVGIGNVVLKMEIPDSVKSAYSYQATRLSIINNQGSIKVRNITFITMNNRYCVHDECDNSDAWHGSKHIYRNCRFISKNGMHNIGVGMSCGDYIFDNCYFEHNVGSCLYMHGWSRIEGANVSITDCALNNTNSNGRGINLGVNSDNISLINISNTYTKNIFIGSENDESFVRNVYDIVCKGVNVSEVVYSDAITDRELVPVFCNW